MNIPFMPENPILANSYVPFQQWETPYSYAEGLQRGTIFPSLDMPYVDHKWGVKGHDV